MENYDHFLEEPINPGKSYRSYRKAAKKKLALGKVTRTIQLKQEKNARDSMNAGVMYYPWPDIWEK